MADFLRQAGSVAAAVGAIFAVTILVVKLPVIRWFWRHNFKDPFGVWVTHTFRAELERTNGGSTLKDQADTAAAMAVEAASRAAELDLKVDDLTVKVDDIAGRLERIERPARVWWRRP